jgi:hypothetical protein
MTPLSNKWLGETIEMTARAIPKYLWLTVSIDVFVGGRCIHRTGGKMKVVGQSYGKFDHNGLPHNIKVQWGRARRHRFPVQVFIDEMLIDNTDVLITNWPVTYSFHFGCLAILVIVMLIEILFLARVIHR